MSLLLLLFVVVVVVVVVCLSYYCHKAACSAIPLEPADATTTTTITST